MVRTMYLLILIFILVAVMFVEVAEVALAFIFGFVERGFLSDDFQGHPDDRKDCVLLGGKIVLHGNHEALMNFCHADTHHVISCLWNFTAKSSKSCVEVFFVFVKVHKYYYAGNGLGDKENLSIYAFCS